MRNPMTLMAVLALCLASLASARPGGHGGPGGPGGFGGPPPGFPMHLLRELDLSPEQKEKIKAIRQANRESMKKLREAARDSRKAVKDALAGGDDATLTKLFNDSQAKHQAMASAAFDQMLKVRAVLTAEQRNKIRALLEEHRAGGPRGGPDRNERPGREFGPEGEPDEED